MSWMRFMGGPVLVGMLLVGGAVLADQAVGDDYTEADACAELLEIATEQSKEAKTKSYGERLLVIHPVLCAAPTSSTTSTTVEATTTTTVAESTTTTAAATTTTTVEPTTSTTQSPAETGAYLDVDIKDGEFYVNGEIVNEGGGAEGMLLNSRMVQAISDFSGQMAFDPETNTTEFIAHLDEYRQLGLDAVTINLQGGLSHRAWGEDYHNSAWSSSGELDAQYASRLAKVLDALAEREMVGIVGLFYFRQDQILDDAAAVSNAVDNAIDFLEPWREGIIVEVINESDHGLVDQASLRRPEPRELVSRLRSAGYHASYSMVPGKVPSRADLGFDTGLKPANVVLLHGNNRSAAEIASMAHQAGERFPGLPIVFNEDGPTGTVTYSPEEYVAHLDAAVSGGAGWGYYDQAGFQTAPVDWSLDSPAKQAVFARIAELSGP